MAYRSRRSTVSNGVFQKCRRTTMFHRDIADAFGRCMLARHRSEESQKWRDDTGRRAGLWSLSLDRYQVAEFFLSH